MNQNSLLNILVQHILTQNRGQNVNGVSLESDMMRKLISENPPPRPQSNHSASSNNAINTPPLLNIDKSVPKPDNAKESKIPEPVVAKK